MDLIVVFTSLVWIVQCYPIYLDLNANPKSFKYVDKKFPKIKKGANESIVHKDFSKIYAPYFEGLDSKCEHDLKKLLLNTHKDYITWGNVKYINLPIIKQPFDNYKIVVATAPPNMKINGESEIVIYIVFPEEYVTNSSLVNIPAIYFVKKTNNEMEEKSRIDPILIIDSNRTVTGLRSKEIAKLLKFKSKLNNLYSNQVKR